ncbi:MAG: hypothetical protein LBT51_09020 [Fusobacteriaceae bacterium]|jgi:hypothetical protein|nr:hypothetical protein [Fusobacteriaceae bacterium]
MFLNNLLDDEKKAFLFLANKIILADGVIEDSEIAVLNALTEEMGIPNVKNELSEEECYKILSVSSNKRKKGYTWNY